MQRQQKQAMQKQCQYKDNEERTKSYVAPGNRRYLKVEAKVAPIRVDYYLIKQDSRLFGTA
jgi:hypothetical protein